MLFYGGSPDRLEGDLDRANNDFEIVRSVLTLTSAGNAAQISALPEIDYQVQGAAREKQLHAIASASKKAALQKPCVVVHLSKLIITHCWAWCLSSDLMPPSMRSSSVSSLVICEC